MAVDKTAVRMGRRRYLWAAQTSVEMQARGHVFLRHVISSPPLVPIRPASYFIKGFLFQKVLYSIRHKPARRVGPIGLEHWPEQSKTPGRKSCRQDAPDSHDRVR